MFTKKRIIIAVSSVVLSVTLWFVWNNILILDDHHPSYGEGISANASVGESLQDEDEKGIGNGSEEEGRENPNKPEDDDRQPIPKGHYIFINLDEHQMYVYKNGELLKQYPVSGGKPTTPSPVGTWKVISKDTWGEGFGGAWLGFNVPWGKYGIHGTVYPWFVGKSNQSKGCIRMLNKDVKELFKIVPHGTIVKVVYKGSPFRTMKSGDVGSDVLEVQKALKKTKYFYGWCGGKYNTELKKAVIKFQKANKLPANGMVNKKTYQMIMELAVQDE